MKSNYSFFKLGFDDCSSNPCPSGTICLDTKDGFSCICPPWQDDCTYGKNDCLFRSKFNRNIIFFVLL